ncbi:MAG TPA: TetR/AcrR family transcriptional regulator [Solirubrobacterales bacterium]|nr:TetR/AcrR family transcriptional regulator [Solirubrobacterales bacterium]
MQQQSEAATQPGVLTPTVPWDIGERSQRQRILGAMASSTAEKTFAGTTIADIVGHASISRATFYKHFANKRECFDATVESFLSELWQAAAEVRSTDDLPAEAIRKAATAGLQRMAKKPAHAKLVLIEAPSVNPAIVRSYRDALIDVLERELNLERATNGADPGIAVGRAKVLLADFLAADRAKELPSLVPEIVYIALLPYVGQEAALQQAGLGA